jgi:SAM-dependent methyltransferase
MRRVTQGETLRRMEAAENYNRWLFSRAQPYLGARVLDVGAGIGTFSALAAEEAEVVALEPDPEFWAGLRARFAERGNVTVVPGTVEELDPVHVGFDSILCLNVLEHIPDDEGTLARFRELLAPGGRLLLLVPAHPSLYGAIDRALEHQRRYRRSGLRALLERTGFEVEQLRAVNPLGTAGWLVSGRIFGRDQIPAGPLKLYDRLVPALRTLDRVDLGFGLSLWAVARRP